jgi:hypothetical protein
MELSYGSPKDTPSFVSLDSGFISSKSGMYKRFKKGMVVTRDDFLIVTTDSLLDSLYINPVKDDIMLDIYFEGDRLRESLGFGENRKYPAPKKGQSLSRKMKEIPIYCLDDSPTIGFANDDTNVTGKIEGTVVDQNGKPLENIRVAYRFKRFFPFIEITNTDSLGNFTFDVYATNIELWCNKYSDDEYIELTVQPDTLLLTTLIVENEISNVNSSRSNAGIDDFNLIGNYPNPFNHSTSIHFTLDKNSRIELNIYSISGQFIKNIFSGYCNSGFHRIKWNGSNVSSGLYLIELKSNTMVAYSKCLLVK